ncbi:MAG: PH domain-containing protein [Catenulispora sp.]|nr:PH domain-containing protein [Catenulispora sp.]
MTATSTTATATPTVLRPRLGRRVAFAGVPVLLNLGAICGVSWAGSPVLPVVVTTSCVAACVALYLVALRPRITIDGDTLDVRNVWGSRRVSRAQVTGLSYSGRRPWPQLELAGGERVPVQAIQSWDREYAVEGARTLRRWYQPSTAKPAAKR